MASLLLFDQTMLPTLFIRPPSSLIPSENYRQRRWMFSLPGDQWTLVKRLLWPRLSLSLSLSGIDTQRLLHNMLLFRLVVPETLWENVLIGTRGKNRLSFPIVHCHFFTMRKHENMARFSSPLILHPLQRGERVGMEVKRQGQHLWGLRWLSFCKINNV